MLALSEALKLKKGLPMPLILLPPSRLLSMGPGPLAGYRLQRRIDQRLRRKARAAVLGIVQGYACGGLGRLSCIHRSLHRFASTPGEKPGPHGDTPEVKMGVRLLGIDAPELHFPLGSEATDAG